MNSRPQEKIPAEEKVRSFLKSVQMLESLPQEGWADLVCASSFVRKNRGEFFFMEDDSPAGGYLLASGKVVLLKRTPKEKLVTMELLGNTEAFGLVCAAQGNPYPLSSKALSESVALHIQQDFLSTVLKRFPEFQSRLLQMCTERIQHSQALASRLVDGSSEVRVANALLLFAEKFSVKQGHVEQIRVSRQELASVASTAVETCIRVTRRMEKAGCISFPGTRQIELHDRPAVELLARGA